MSCLVVDADTGVSGKVIHQNGCGPGTVLLEILVADLVQFPGGDTGTDMPLHQHQCLEYYPANYAKFCQVLFVINSHWRSLSATLF